MSSHRRVLPAVRSSEKVEGAIEPRFLSLEDSNWLGDSATVEPPTVSAPTLSMGTTTSKVNEAGNVHASSSRNALMRSASASSPPFKDLHGRRTEHRLSALRAGQERKMGRANVEDEDKTVERMEAHKQWVSEWMKRKGL